MFGCDWMMRMMSSHLHHGPGAEAGPDHICDRLKHRHIRDNKTCVLFQSDSVCSVLILDPSSGDCRFRLTAVTLGCGHVKMFLTNMLLVVSSDSLKTNMSWFHFTLQQHDDTAYTWQCHELLEFSVCAAVCWKLTAVPPVQSLRSRLMIFLFFIRLTDQTDRKKHTHTHSIN